MTKERIEIIRQSLIPFVKKELLKINYEGLGKSDAEEFEKDLNEVLDLASKALEQQSSEDCVSRQAVIAQARDYGSETFLIPVNSVKALPPVTPIHGTCKDCKHRGEKYEDSFYECAMHDGTFESTFYCRDFERRE